MLNDINKKSKLFSGIIKEGIIIHPFSQEGPDSYFEVIQNLTQFLEKHCDCTIVNDTAWHDTLDRSSILSGCSFALVFYSSARVNNANAAYCDLIQLADKKRTVHNNLKVFPVSFSVMPSGEIPKQFSSRKPFILMQDIDKLYVKMHGLTQLPKNKKDTVCGLHYTETEEGKLLFRSLTVKMEENRRLSYVKKEASSPAMENRNRDVPSQAHSSLEKCKRELFAIVDQANNAQTKVTKAPVSTESHPLVLETAEFVEMKDRLTSSPGGTNTECVKPKIRQKKVAAIVHKSKHKNNKQCSDIDNVDRNSIPLSEVQRHVSGKSSSFHRKHKPSHAPQTSLPFDYRALLYLPGPVSPDLTDSDDEDEDIKFINSMQDSYLGQSSTNNSRFQHQFFNNKNDPRYGPQFIPQIATPDLVNSYGNYDPNDWLFKNTHFENRPVYNSEPFPRHELEGNGLGHSYHSHNFHSERINGDFHHMQVRPLLHSVTGREQNFSKRQHGKSQGFQSLGYVHPSHFEHQPLLSQHTEDRPAPDSHRGISDYGEGMADFLTVRGKELSNKLHFEALDPKYAQSSNRSNTEDSERHSSMSPVSSVRSSSVPGDLSYSGAVFNQSIPTGNHGNEVAFIGPEDLDDSEECHDWISPDFHQSTDLDESQIQDEMVKLNNKSAG